MQVRECCRQMLVRNRETNWREKASREKANKMKKKKKKQEKKNIFIEAKQLAAQWHVWVA